MAEWKKVIVSGSDAHLSSVTASNAGAASGSDNVVFYGAGGEIRHLSNLYLTGSGENTLEFNGGTFSGSFIGDGSQLTGVAGTFNYTGSLGSGSVDLLTQALTLTGSAEGIVVSGSEQTLTFKLDNDVTIANKITAVTMSIGYITASNGVIQDLTASYAMNAQTTAINSGMTYHQAVAAATWSVQHNLITKYPLVAVWDDTTDRIIEPSEIISIDYDNIDIYFTTPVSGYVNVSRAGHVLSGSVLWSSLLTSSNASGREALEINMDITGSVSASEGFSGSFYGDGSGLTGITAEWDGSHFGNASITGSFTVSGSTGTVVDFTGVDAISGSIFSGSFVGDGSGLTGIASTLYYTGSIGSGSINLKDEAITLTGSANGIVVSGSGTTLTYKLDDNIVINNNLTLSNGTATITGSLIVSGGADIDLTGVNAISGSIFSGSFVGDGSGLTGLAGYYTDLGSGKIVPVDYEQQQISITGNSGYSKVFAVSSSIEGTSLYSAIFGGLRNRIGYGSANTSNSVILGGQSNAVSQSNAVIVGGVFNTVSGNGGAILAGSANKAEGGNSVVLNGSSNRAIGTQSTILNGSGNKAMGNASVILAGSSNWISGSNTVIFSGNTNKVLVGGSNSLIQGSTNEVSGSYNFVLGTQNANSGWSAFTVGQQNTNKGGQYNTVFGVQNTVDAGSSYNLVNGWLNEVIDGADYNLVNGLRNVSDTSYQTVIGKYNESGSGAYFVIGNGTGTGAQRSNLVEMHENYILFNAPVSSSIFSGSFYGDGSNLTNVTAEWDGTHLGDASITGSFTVSGSAGTIVDFTGVDAISGSIFSGSFVGDGSGLTGIASTLNLSASNGGSGSFDLKDSILIVSGTDNQVKVTYDHATGTLTYGLHDNVIIPNNLTVTGDFVVFGTSSTVQSENLIITDQFALLASGSSISVDGGLVIQSSSNGSGSAFGLDASANRWAMQTSSAADITFMAPNAYVTTTEFGVDANKPTNPTYGGASNGYGNIWVSTDTSEIWIWA